MADLTNKQRVFVEEYLSCWNGAESARRAGYAFPRVESVRLLANPNIASAISARIAEKAMAADEVLARLADQARGDMRTFLVTKDDGTPDRFDLSKDKPLHLVKKVSITDKGISFELYDAQAALVHLGKHHGLFVDRQEISGTLGLYEIVIDDDSGNNTTTGQAPDSPQGD